MKFDNKSWYQRGYEGDKGPTSGFLRHVEHSWGKKFASLDELKYTDVNKWRKERNDLVTSVGYFYTVLISVPCSLAVGYWFGIMAGTIFFAVIVVFCLWVIKRERETADRKWIQKLEKEEARAKAEAEAKKNAQEEETIKNMVAIYGYMEKHRENNYAIMPDNDLVSGLHKKKKKSNVFGIEMTLKQTILLLIIMLLFAVTMSVLT